MNLPTITSGQWAAAGRHVVSYSMGAVSAFAAMKIISGGDAANLQTAINQISTGVADIVAGTGTLVTTGLGWYAAWTASHPKQLASVKSAIANGNLPGVTVTETPAAKVANQV